MKIELFFSVIILIAFIGFTSAITTINPDVVLPGEEIKLTIKPSKQGFYNTINVMQGQDVVDLINIDCPTICTKRKTAQYVVPEGFAGDYYFTTFDYEINDYELDNFSVINQSEPPPEPPPETPEGTLTIEEILNTDAGVHTLIYPEQGKNANITILTKLKIKNCQDYGVIAYLCDSNISQCNQTQYTHQIPLTLSNQVGRNCWFSYEGEDYFPFYQLEDNWTAFVKSGLLEASENFIYNSLTAIDYPSFINFGNLNAQTWNIGVPEQTPQLTNFGNTPFMAEWSSEGFICVSENCTGFWSTFHNEEKTFQIDDDTQFLEENETGFNPSFITNFTIDYFPSDNISVCISQNCTDNIGEKINTSFNLKLPQIQRGNYQGDIVISLY